MRDQVALRAAGDEQRRFLAEHRRDPFLQRIDARVVAEDVVADSAAAIAARIAAVGRVTVSLPGPPSSCIDASRKFFSSAWPCSVRIDSGWNWTPSSSASASSLWRTPMISPSRSAPSLRAVGQRRALDRQRVIADRRKAVSAEPRNTPRRSWIDRRRLLPCIDFFARTTLPPKPRRWPGGQGRRRGSAACRRSAWTRRREMPASSGVHGTGRDARSGRAAAPRCRRA